MSVSSRSVLEEFQFLLRDAHLRSDTEFHKVEFSYRNITFHTTASLSIMFMLFDNFSTSRGR